MKSQKVCWARLKVHILPIHRPWQYWNFRTLEFKMMDNFSSFCNSTSLHGWPHVPGAKTLERLFWLLTIALMVVLAASFCSRYRKGLSFLQVLSSCLWKWSFIAKKNFIELLFWYGQMNFPFQHFDGVPNVNSVNESDLLNRVYRQSEVSQDCYLQQISAQVKLWSSNCQKHLILACARRERRDISLVFWLFKLTKEMIVWSSIVLIFDIFHILGQSRTTAGKA